MDKFNFETLADMYNEGEPKPYFDHIPEREDTKHYPLGQPDSLSIKHHHQWIERQFPKSSDIECYTTTGNMGCAWVAVVAKRNGQFTYAFKKLFELFQEIDRGIENGGYVDELAYWAMHSEAEQADLVQIINERADEFDHNKLTAEGIESIVSLIRQSDGFCSVEENGNFWFDFELAGLRGKMAITYVLQHAGYCWNSKPRHNFYVNNFGSICFGTSLLTPVEFCRDDDYNVFSWARRTGFLPTAEVLAQCVEKPWASMAFIEDALVAHMQENGRAEKWTCVHRYNYHKNREVQ